MAMATAPWYIVSQARASHWVLVSIDEDGVAEELTVQHGVDGVETDQAPRE